MEHLFLGKYDRKVDGSFRVRMPKRFMPTDGSFEYYLYYKKSRGVISIYPRDVIEEIANQWENKDRKSEIAMTLSEGCFVDMDAYGKILIPHNMRDCLGPDRNVVLIGAFHVIDMMSKERYEQELNQDFSDYFSHLRNK